MKPSKPWLFLLCGLLSLACVTSGPRLSDEPAASWEEVCADEHSLVLLDDEASLGLYRCKDMVAEGALLAYRGGGITLPAAPGSPRRWWGRPLFLPRDAEAVFIIPWRNHDWRPPPPQLPPGRWNKHHIFPQAPDLARWFKRQGVDIHQHTLVIPYDVHVRIHSGAPRGGVWNEAWRNFREARPDAPPEEIWRYAIKLIVHYELSGPVIPYSYKLPPPAP